MCCFGGYYLESGSIDLLQNIESVELDSRLVYFVDVIFFFLNFLVKLQLCSSTEEVIKIYKAKIRQIFNGGSNIRSGTI